MSAGVNAIQSTTTSKRRPWSARETAAASLMSALTLSAPFDGCRRVLSASKQCQTNAALHREHGRQLRGWSRNDAAARTPLRCSCRLDRIYSR